MTVKIFINFRGQSIFPRLAPRPAQNTKISRAERRNDRLAFLVVAFVSCPIVCADAVPEAPSTRVLHQHLMKVSLISKNGKIYRGKPADGVH